MSGLQGEISRVGPTRSGPLNFTLADRNEKIECVIFDQLEHLRGNLPSVGSQVSVKGQIYVYDTISEYRFRVTDIHRTGVPFPAPCLSINDLTDALRDTLNQEPPIEVQGEIDNIFEFQDYTILKLKDVTTDGRVNEVIECALPQRINPPFPLQQGNRITVKGKFEIFAKASAYQIEINDANNIRQIAEQPTQSSSIPNECSRCHQRFNNLRDQLCHICYDANLTSEGIVVGCSHALF